MAYAPMNPMWAQGFAQREGRQPSQADWERYQDFLRRGKQPEQTSADQIAPFVAPLGSLAGAYGASKIPALFSSSVGPATATTAGATTAGTVSAPTVLGASKVVAPTTLGASSFATVGIPAVGAALIGKGVYDLVQGKKTKGLGDWASRGSLAIATGGISEIVKGLGLFDGPKTQVEEGRWKDLEETGAQIPEWVKSGQDIKDAGYRSDLSSDFKGLDASGIWANNSFAKSRAESDLRPEDIWGYASMVETFGPQYQQGSEENRRAIAQKALDLGLVDEHHGTVDIKANDELMKEWEALNAIDTDRIKKILK